MQLSIEEQHLSSQSYTQASAVILEPIEQGTAKRFPLQLEAGTYAIVAACGASCDHVQLSLYEAAGALLVSSPEKQEVVIVAGTPTVAGPFTLELAAPGCKQSACYAGFVIWRKELQSSHAPAAANLVSPPADQVYAGKLTQEPALFVAHVSSEKTHEDALGTYAKLRVLAPVALATRLPLIHEVDLGSRGLWYRLRIGPPMSEAEAQALCVNIKTEGHSYCVTQPVDDNDADAKAPTSLEKNDSVDRFDGTWMLTWKARDCQLPDGSTTATYAMAVSNGRLTGLGGRLSGKVSATGTANWTVTAKTDGVLVRYTGTLSPNSAAGRFARADGTCAGTFTVRRRPPREKSTDGVGKKSGVREKALLTVPVLDAEEAGASVNTNGPRAKAPIIVSPPPGNPPVILPLYRPALDNNRTAITPPHITVPAPPTKP